MRSLLLLMLCLAGSRAFSLPHLRNSVSPRAVTPRTVPVVDVERLKAVGLAALASVALVASPMPAHAKGGGHGGGGGGGGGHSTSHSSSSSSYRPSYPRSSSLSYRSSQRSCSSSKRSSGSSLRERSYYGDRNIRIFPTDAEAREGGGLVCPANLPTVGSKVDVVGHGTATVIESRPALQSDLYPASRGLRSQVPLPPGLDEGCTLSVQYSDGSTDTISAAETPKSEIEETLDALTLPAVAAFYGFVIFGDGASSTYASSKFDEMETILSDVLDATSPRPDPATADAMAALSGEYWGGSERESDGGDQSVRVTLTFKRDGRIQGRGRDGEDGSYTIPRGRWVREDDGRLWVAWEEKYDEGFRVVCIGHIDAATGKVKANFASSRRVTGAFSLAKKPSVF